MLNFETPSNRDSGRGARQPHSPNTQRRTNTTKSHRERPTRQSSWTRFRLQNGQNCFQILAVVAFVFSFTAIIMGIYFSSWMSDAKVKLGRMQVLLDQSYTNCHQLKLSGIGASGVQTIQVNGKTIQVYCDMTTDGGGWTVIQRRSDGSEDFYRQFSDYVDGFGNIRGEHWIGLLTMHEMTRDNKYKLRVDLEDFDGNKAYALYNVFIVRPVTRSYELGVGEFSGTATDALSPHDGMGFSAKDVDNDAALENCAEEWKGGWWYTNCLSACLNGIYVNGGKENCKGIVWQFGSNAACYSLKNVEMKIKPAE